jgi:hypothetical protein
MARGPVQPGALRSKEEQQAARAAVVAKVTELLQSGPKTAAEMYPEVVCLRPTFSNYLNHMHKSLRLIHMTGTYRNRGELWAWGADTALPTRDDEIDHVFAVKRGTAPARQIGMHRDLLVAALFGPAQGAAAC